MPHYRIREAADLLGVSDDTVRRWVESGALTPKLDGAGRQVLDGAELAAFAHEHAGASASASDPTPVLRSARNRFVGLVTEVRKDGVMAQVEMQCGPHTVVSLMSADAANELGLAAGSRAVAVVKATMVIVETQAVA